MNRKLLAAPALFLAAALWLSPLSPAWSGLLNGDFSDPTGLAGWTATGAIISEPTGAFAQLETDDSYLRTLEQTFLLPAAPARLFFDFAFSTSIDTVPAGIFLDSFAVSLFTSDYLLYLDILVVDVYGALPDPSDGIEGITGALPIAVGLDPAITIAGFAPFTGGFTTAGRVALWLPATVRGQEATLFFDLFDEPDGANTRAAIDNVAVAAVPAPATLSLVLLGLAAAGVARRRSAS